MAPRPELLATGPNEVWSWDMTKLLGPVKSTYYYLYMILDILSRYVVGWIVAHAERACLVERLIAATCETQDIAPSQLTVHADRGTSMTSKAVALLLADLGITRTHNRPYVSNDNPFSEAQLKTLKSRPEFPERFGSVESGPSTSATAAAPLETPRSRGAGAGRRPDAGPPPHVRREDTSIRGRGAGPLALTVTSNGPSSWASLCVKVMISAVALPC